MSGIYRSSKTFRDYPCAHRRWRHDGRCAWVHGYSREFIFWFGSRERTENGFVMDFGRMGELKAWLDDHFDHTLLLDTDDPLRASFEALEQEGALKLVTFEDVGMEGTARFVYEWANEWVRKVTQQRVWVVSVEVRENQKNSAIYLADPG